MSKKQYYVYHKSLGNLVCDKGEDKKEPFNWYFERVYRVWSDRNEPYCETELITFDSENEAANAMTDAVIQLIDALQEEGRVGEVE